MVHWMSPGDGANALTADDSTHSAGVRLEFGIGRRTPSSIGSSIGHRTPS